MEPTHAINTAEYHGAQRRFKKWRMDFGQKKGTRHLTQVSVLLNKQYFNKKIKYEYIFLYVICVNIYGLV